MAVMETLGIVKRQPRKESSSGWFSQYDANVVEGLLIGAGMASTGAYPLLVHAQVPSLSS